MHGATDLLRCFNKRAVLLYPATEIRNSAEQNCVKRFAMNLSGFLLNRENLCKTAKQLGGSIFSGLTAEEQCGLCF